MRSRLLATALFLPSVLLTTVALPAAAGCQHLLVDPAGDVDEAGRGPVPLPYPSQVDNPTQVDVRWAELRTTKTKLIATIRLQDLAPESGQTLDHAYSVTFDNRGTSIELLAMFGATDQWARASTSAAGDDRPEDGGVYVGAYLGPVEAVRDLKRDRVTLTVDLDLLGGVDKPIARLSAVSWVAVKQGEGGTYAVADTGSTKRTYRPGARDCLTP